MSFDFTFIRQDIKTEIEWDVEWDFDKEVDKDFDIDVDVKVDVDGNGSDLELVLKDLDAGDGGVALIADTTAIEDTMSTATLTAITDNVVVQADSSALDSTAAGLKDGRLDSDTWAEIDIGVDYKAYDFAIVTVNMEAFVEG